jgi:integrase
VRNVPLVIRPTVPRMHRRTWEDKVRERTGRAIVPYDLRRTYAHWLEEAGIPRTRRRMYLGHGARDATDLYESHEVEGFLAEDAAKPRQFLEVSHEKSHGLKVEKA